MKSTFSADCGKKSCQNKKRTAGAVLTYIFIAAIAAVTIVIAIHRLGRIDADNIALTATKTLNDFSEMLAGVQIKLAELGLLTYLTDGLSGTSDNVSDAVQGFIGGLAANISKIGRHMVNISIGFVVAFYFLRDKAAIQKSLKELISVFLPKRVGSAIKRLANEVDFVFCGYIRGQLTDACVMAVLISVWLSIIKVNFAVVIGVFSGFSNIIPYFGAIVGFGLSVSAALIGGEPLKALYAAAGIIALQQIDGIFIVPKIVGKSVRLNPAVILLSLSAGGALFGIWGLIFAVPVSAVGKMYIERYVEWKKEKKSNSTDIF